MCVWVVCAKFVRRCVYESKVRQVCACALLFVFYTLLLGYKKGMLGYYAFYLMHVRRCVFFSIFKSYAYLRFVSDFKGY